MKVTPILSAAAFALVAICGPKSVAASDATKPAAEPTPVVTVRIPGNPKQYNNWLDAPQTPGAWNYASNAEETSATFTMAESKPRFGISCDLASKRVTLSHFGVIAAKGTEMTIRTRTLERKLPTHTPDRTVFETLSYLEAGDELLDAMTLATDRFAVELGGSSLYLPASPEVAKVIADCQ